MPRIIKNTVPHILISMIVAPMMLLAFAWAGNEFITNRDVKVYMPHLEKKIDKLIANQDRYLDIAMKNKSDISYLKGVHDDKSNNSQ